MQTIRNSIRSVTMTAAIGLCAYASCCAAQTAHVAPSPQIYVTNEISGDLSIIDADTLKVVATVPLGRRPRGIEASPDGRHLFIALSGSPISKPGAEEKSLPADKSADGIGEFDATTRTLTRVIRGVSDPEKLALSRDGKRLYIASEDTGAAVVVDVASGKTIASVQVGGEPEGVRVSPNGRYVYVTSESAGSASVIDTATNTLLGQFKVGQRPRSVAFSPDDSAAYVPGEFDASVTVVDVHTHAPTGRFDLADKTFRPMDAMVSRDGRQLYLSTGRGRMLVAVDTKTEKVVRSVAVGARPWGLAMSSDGKRLYVANGPSNDLSVIDAATFKVIATVPVGTGPWGTAVFAGR